MNLAIKILKIIGIAFSVLLLLFVFAPKTNLYYYAEEMLQKSLIISDESVESTPFSLRVTDGKIYFNSIKAAEFSSLTLSSMLLFTTIEMETIFVDEMLGKVGVYDTKRVEVSHSIFSPLTLDIKVENNQGEIEGYFDISAKTLHLVYTPNRKDERFRTLLGYFKPIDGELIYEKTF